MDRSWQRAAWRVAWAFACGFVFVTIGCGAAPPPRETSSETRCSAQGCADETDETDEEVDSDADGIIDASDQCPTVAEDVDGFEDDDGCPDIDNDQDRVADVDDMCPEEPENYNGVDDEDGCPDEEGPCILPWIGVTFRPMLTFDRNEITWPPEQEEQLNALAELLNYEGMPVVSLWAYSPVGERRRRELSRRRVAALHAALLSRGIAPSQLGPPAIDPYDYAGTNQPQPIAGITPFSFELDAACGVAREPYRIVGVEH